VQKVGWHFFFVREYRHEYLPISARGRVVVLDLVLPIGSIAPIVGYEGQQNIVTITDMPSGYETTPEFFQHGIAANEHLAF
jgi:hypothetical protein